jgi:DNA polymerase-1
VSKKLLAVDFLNLAFRAYFAPGYQGLKAPDGRPSGATFGLLAMTQALIAACGATHVVFAFESKEPTWREELDPAYKIGRPVQPEEFHQQKDQSNQFIGLMGWGRYRSPRHEADDTLATLSRRALKEGFEHVYIATSDKDLFGTVTDNVSMLWTAQGMGKIKENTFTPTKVKEKYGVLPDLFADWKSLAGDASDKISGCPGVGPLGATSLMQAFGSVEYLYRHLDEVKSVGLRNKLEAGREQVLHSHKLVTLNFEADLTPEFDPNVGELGCDDREKTKSYLESWGMRSILNRLPPVKVQPGSPEDFNF